MSPVFFPAVVRKTLPSQTGTGSCCATPNDHSKELAYLNELRTYLPSGLIVIPSNFSDLTAQAESYRRAGTAVVYVDSLPKNWSGDTVTANNEHGAYEATSYMLRVGHRKLAIIPSLARRSWPTPLW